MYSVAVPFRHSSAISINPESISRCFDRLKVSFGIIFVYAVKGNLKQVCPLLEMPIAIYRTCAEGGSSWKALEANKLSYTRKKALPPFDINDF